VSTPDPGAQRRADALLAVRSLATARLAIDSPESPGIATYEAMVWDVVNGIFRSSPDTQVVVSAVADHLAAFGHLLSAELVAVASMVDVEWRNHPDAVTPAMLHEVACRMLERMG
jgi:hypothetical protein